MDIFDRTELTLQRAIEGAALRQQVLSENLANANVPGYQRRDVDFHGALRAAMDRDAPVADVGFAVEVEPGATRADGNGVDLDVESADLAETGLTYQALVQVARGRIDILESAMGSR
jgi:flagellar basal-body rod protein FlgB